MTTARTPSASLKARLAAPDIVVAPGVYDALSASLAQQAGFDTVYLSGASLAYTKLGRPDIGLLGLSEVNESLAYIRERCDLDVVVDCDTGFGNAINVMRSVRMLERSGASAIQLEDQTYPKRCGHLRGKTLVSSAEMEGKIKAAVDARHSDQTLIIGRTDAIAVDGIDAALERAQAYYQAGADMVFVEGIRTAEQLDKVMTVFRGKAPIMANMVEGGDTPLQDAKALQELGFSLVIFPGALVRAYTHMAMQFFQSLRDNGTTDPFRERMLDFQQLNDYLGTAQILQQGQSYEDPSRL